jgi:N-acetylmuramoyl-L-alanine amidase
LCRPLFCCASEIANPSFRESFVILLCVPLMKPSIRAIAFVSSTVVLLGTFAAHSQNATAGSAAPQGGTISPAQNTTSGRTVLNIVVLDPAHGGTDPGARGSAGVREADIVLELTAQLRRSLESQGFQVLQTRTNNENPSFDDRSALANAQNGAIFVSLHISSTGLAGTVRVYTMPDMAQPQINGGLIPWDQAQASYLPLSRKLGDAVQGELTQRFKGSPMNVQSAYVRQLRTTAAPAIAVEVSSVAMEDKADLDRMLPGVADAIVRGIVAFRPSYVTPSAPGTALGAKP